MSKKEKNDLINLCKDDFDISIGSLEEVPYLNNDGDEIQDTLKEARNLTIGLKNEITKNINKNSSNILKVNFNKNKK